ncbi:hypothetical protein NW768_007320, partial [Fusarium equiseti]
MTATKAAKEKSNAEVKCYARSQAFLTRQAVERKKALFGDQESIVDELPFDQSHVIGMECSGPECL